ncbi:Conserved oligomeric Golgi complex subunit 8 [Amphibalanus amphitrite]|uniref:Conserved oligomeric Golgi complex subunit 8 n=1 Tax=Amphibalanus amphitrite TaxID=1232801 RepID=A0A6A4W9T5_AMPAM|nr:Conserved oligomeric Golgi complex subunit 8 [Amphibalanus amphitrite]
MSYADSNVIPELENDVDVNNYLAQISTFGVERLRTEGSRIQEETAHTLQQTQDLAFQNYKTFVETAECSSAVLEEFTSVEERLDHLLSELPEFAARCAEFGRRGGEIHARRRLNSATLTKHTELLEVLELPQLMDTAVRNGYYDQAMQLVTHVRALEKKHGHIKLVESIVNDVQLAYRLMLTQLVSQLRTNIQLPQCLKVIGHLRRMEVYTEFELRLKFLQARNAWLEEQLANISREDPYHHISKTIEVSRVGLFDIVTQYRAVFSDESALLQAGADEAAPAIFYEWINLKVGQFLSTLRQDLARGVGGRLDSLLSQTMYFGLSLARIGADLRPLAAPLFSRAALAQFERAVTAATTRFRQSVDAFTCMRARVSAPASSAPAPPGDQDILQPPTSLLDYLPLAHYCNGVLAAFNELRLCPALGLVHDVSTRLSDSLTAVVGRVVELYHTDSQGLTEEERVNYSRFCRCLARDLVPYLSGCLAAVFPVQQLAPALGLTVAVVTKRGIGSLDVPALVSPLQEFLQSQEPPPAAPQLPVASSAPPAESRGTAEARSDPAGAAAELSSAAPAASTVEQSTGPSADPDRSTGPPAQTAGPVGSHGPPPPETAAAAAGGAGTAGTAAAGEAGTAGSSAAGEAGTAGTAAAGETRTSGTSAAGEIPTEGAGAAPLAAGGTAADGAGPATTTETPADRDTAVEETQGAPGGAADPALLHQALEEEDEGLVMTAPPRDQ